ncbi:alpha-ketoglutarate-dependent dioxygenase AlkB [Achromobacter mucicolens]|uniref:alpha-ketoglutarate-dependent dioxygenase AlkB n=1 Tax=Achromobacter mucicolens TaxID=1389922 RepID=UPI001CBA93D4|nr:alpha-ketoglutarate-dependent dioxygenase AlkB [Achromobacter mucicolens]
MVRSGLALPTVDALLAGVDDLTAQASCRHMETFGSYTRSVALTNCGDLGWTTDARGYRYSRIDPVSGQPWPALPQALRQWAQDAAREAASDCGHRSCGKSVRPTHQKQGSKKTATGVAAGGCFGPRHTKRHGPHPPAPVSQLQPNLPSPSMCPTSGPMPLRRFFCRRSCVLPT